MPLTPHAREDEKLTWVPTCVACGAQLDEPVATGDERRPQPAEDLFGKVHTCTECGATMLIGPDTVWIRVDVTASDRARTE